MTISPKAHVTKGAPVAANAMEKKTIVSKMAAITPEINGARHNDRYRSR